MKDTSIIGIDLSKRSFELHGATAEGTPVFRKRLSRGRLLAFLQDQPSCRIVMEAWVPITGAARTGPWATSMR